MSQGDAWLACMAQDIQYPVADLEGDLVWAADLSSSLGRPSGLVCVGCGEPMIARLGTKRRPHFGHRPGSTCSGGETALHRTAIRTIEHGILEAASEGRPYPLVVHCDWCSAERQGDLARERNLTIDVDRSLAPGLRPDVVAKGTDGSALYCIEVIVTHVPEPVALAAYEELDVPVFSVRPTWEGLEAIRLGFDKLKPWTELAPSLAGSIEMIAGCRFPRHFTEKDELTATCPECPADARIVVAGVSTGLCWSKTCDRPTRALDIYARINGVATLVAAGASDLKGVETIGPENGVRLERRYSSTAGTSYLANICECGKILGDMFVYGGLGSDEYVSSMTDPASRYIVCRNGHWTVIRRQILQAGANVSRGWHTSGLTGSASGLFDDPYAEYRIPGGKLEVRDPDEISMIFSRVIAQNRG